MIVASFLFSWTKLLLYAEMRLAGARQTKGDEVNDDDIPSTSGRQFTEGVDGDLLPSDVPKVDRGLVWFLVLIPLEILC